MRRSSSGRGRAATRTATAGDPYRHPADAGQPGVATRARRPSGDDAARHARRPDAARAVAPGRAQFVLTVMVLLGIGLVATLWLSTAAAADSYRLQDARAAARDLSERSERLHRDVAALQSPPALAQRATQLGMVPAKDPARLVVAADGAARSSASRRRRSRRRSRAAARGLGGGVGGHRRPRCRRPSPVSAAASSPRRGGRGGEAGGRRRSRRRRGRRGAARGRAGAQGRRGRGGGERNRRRPDDRRTRRHLRRTGTSQDRRTGPTTARRRRQDGTDQRGAGQVRAVPDRAATRAHRGTTRRNAARATDAGADGNSATRSTTGGDGTATGDGNGTAGTAPGAHGHRLMPAAPPRTRPAGAARSSPSAPRPARGGRPATRAADPRRRLRVGQLVLVVALALATVKLVVVQGPQAGTLQAGSARQRTSEITLPAERGSILDRAGAPLAFSVEARALVTNPRLIATTKGAGTAAYVSEMAAAVAQATGADANVLRGSWRATRATSCSSRWSTRTSRATLRDQFPEIAEEQRESRQYPGGALAANVVGVASWNSTDRKLTGLMGLESSQDNLLAGQAGLRVVDTAEGSSAVIPGSTRFERPATPGSDLQLTLDSDLQYTVQRQLAEYAAEKGAKGGSAVVLDAKTGEVLAMANARTFDPRDVAHADESTLGNAAVSSPYEPGSVNKVVTMAAALEYHTATPDRVFAVPGSIRVADRTVNDAWNHGTEDYTLTGILAKSSNVGTIMAAREVGEDRFADMLARFGLGKRTGVGLPGESPGRVPGAGDLVGVDVRQPADRAGPVGDGAADGRDVPGRRQRRRARPAADRGGHDRAGRCPHPDARRPSRCGSSRRRPRGPCARCSPP